MPKNTRNSAWLSGRGRTVAGAALLVALVVAAYRPALSAGYVWDDDVLLTANANVRSLEGLGRTWTDPQANYDYYPLTHTSFWVEYHLWQLAPLGYHLDNILLHAAGAVLVWWILRRLAIPGAWVAAAIFAQQPPPGAQPARNEDGLHAATQRTAAAEDGTAKPSGWKTAARAEGVSR